MIHCATSGFANNVTSIYRISVKSIKQKHKIRINAPKDMI